MKFTTDFTTISDDVRKTITEAIAQNLDATPVLICKDSNHTDDDYLYLYIAQKGNSYIAGLANTSSRKSIGLYENHYGCTFKQALEIIADKIHDCNKEV